MVGVKAIVSTAFPLQGGVMARRCGGGNCSNFAAVIMRGVSGGFLRLFPFKGW
uniref:Uncharacterized protein n=1 Tax=Acetobacter pasteurianus TaxID=438 RepID=I3W080_ACEPA|nr:hypothetical protein [Acetobacter pasteurianus]